MIYADHPNLVCPVQLQLRFAMSFPRQPQSSHAFIGFILVATCLASPPFRIGHLFAATHKRVWRRACCCCCCCCCVVDDVILVIIVFVVVPVVIFVLSAVIIVIVVVAVSVVITAAIVTIFFDRTLSCPCSVSFPARSPLPSSQLLLRAFVCLLRFLAQALERGTAEPCNSIADGPFCRGLPEQAAMPRPTCRIILVLRKMAPKVKLMV